MSTFEPYILKYPCIPRRTPWLSSQNACSRYCWIALPEIKFYMVMSMAQYQQQVDMLNVPNVASY